MPSGPELIAAIQAKDVAKAESLLRAGAPANYVHRNTFNLDVTTEVTSTLTPLHFAAETGQTELCRLLVSRGALLEAGDFDRSTPLIFAIKARHAETALALLDLGADPKAEARYESATALTLAIRTRSLPLIKRLLESNPSPAERKQAFSHASLLGDPAVLSLLAPNAAPTAESMAQLAAGNHIELLKSQLATHPIPDKTQLAPALREAARHGHNEMVALLLDQQAPINHPDQWGQTALTYAACENHVQVLKLLLANGANPHPKDSQGFTPADRAEQLGAAEAAQLLRSIP